VLGEDDQVVEIGITIAGEVGLGPRFGRPRRL